MLSERFSIERTGAILSTGAAELNPAQCAAGCPRAAQRLGARIYAPISVEKIDAAIDGVELTTATGGRIRARRVVFATGYEVAPGIPKGEYQIISSWAIATKPLKPDAFWPLRCLIWEASDPYLYLRSTNDNRIVAGGLDSRTDRSNSARPRHRCKEPCTAGKGRGAAARMPARGRLCLGRGIRRQPDRASPYRRGRWHGELPFRAGMRRQWHHLQYGRRAIGAPLGRRTPRPRR